VFEPDAISHDKQKENPNFVFGTCNVASEPGYSDQKWDYWNYNAAVCVVQCGGGVGAAAN
jgi:hypothetical protein